MVQRNVEGNAPYKTASMPLSYLNKDFPRRLGMTKLLRINNKIPSGKTGGDNCSISHYKLSERID